MDFKDFIMTTGAATPVAIHTEEGNKIQKRFDHYLHDFTSEEITPQETAQYITNMFKICLEEYITGQVASPPVPFGKAALAERTDFGSENFH